MLEVLVYLGSIGDCNHKKSGMRGLTKNQARTIMRFGLKQTSIPCYGCVLLNYMFGDVNCLQKQQKRRDKRY